MSTGSPSIFSNIFIMSLSVKSELSELLAASYLLDAPAPPVTVTGV
jgi:hypothetical protein